MKNAAVILLLVLMLAIVAPILSGLSPWSTEAVNGGGSWRASLVEAGTEYELGSDGTGLTVNGAPIEEAWGTDISGAMVVTDLALVRPVETGSGWAWRCASPLLGAAFVDSADLVLKVNSTRYMTIEAGEATAAGRVQFMAVPDPSGGLTAFHASALPVHAEKGSTIALASMGEDDALMGFGTAVTLGTMICIADGAPAQGSAEVSFVEDRRGDSLSIDGFALTGSATLGDYILLAPSGYSYQTESQAFTESLFALMPMALIAVAVMAILKTSYRR